MKKYFGKYLLGIAYFIFAVLFGILNGAIYTKLFGGFPYPILDFSFIMFLIWFIIIVFGVYIFRKKLISFNTKPMEFAIFLCAILGIYGFADIQLQQRTNNYNYSKIRYDNSKERLELFLNDMTRKYDYWNVQNSETFNFSKAYVIQEKEEIDSLIIEEDIDKIEDYLTVLKSSKVNKIYIFGSLTLNMESYLKNLKEYKKAIDDLENEKNNDYQEWSLLIFLSTIVLGFLKISIEFINDNKNTYS